MTLIDPSLDLYGPPVPFSVSFSRRPVCAQMECRDLVQRPARSRGRSTVAGCGVFRLCHFSGHLGQLGPGRRSEEEEAADKGTCWPALPGDSKKLKSSEACAFLWGCSVLGKWHHSPRWYLQERKTLSRVFRPWKVIVLSQGLSCRKPTLSIN